MACDRDIQKWLFVANSIADVDHYLPFIIALSDIKKKEEKPVLFVNSFQLHYCISPVHRSFLKKYNISVQSLASFHFLKIVLGFIFYMEYFFSILHSHFIKLKYPWYIRFYILT